MYYNIYSIELLLKKLLKYLLILTSILLIIGGQPGSKREKAVWVPVPGFKLLKYGNAIILH